MKRILIAAALSVALTGPAAASSLESDMQEMERAARDMAEQLMSSMKTFMQGIPTYEPPEVLDNGDIIIRRKRDNADEERTHPEPERSVPRDDDGGLTGGATNI